MDSFYVSVFVFLLNKLNLKQYSVCYESNQFSQSSATIISSLVTYAASDQPFFMRESHVLPIVRGTVNRYLHGWSNSLLFFKKKSSVDDINDKILYDMETLLGNMTSERRLLLQYCVKQWRLYKLKLGFNEWRYNNRDSISLYPSHLSTCNLEKQTNIFSNLIDDIRSTLINISSNISETQLARHDDHITVSDLQRKMTQVTNDIEELSEKEQAMKQSFGTDVINLSNKLNMLRGYFEVTSDIGSDYNPKNGGKSVIEASPSTSASITADSLVQTLNSSLLTLTSRMKELEASSLGLRQQSQQHDSVVSSLQLKYSDYQYILTPEMFHIRQMIDSMNQSKHQLHSAVADALQQVTNYEAENKSLTEQCNTLLDEKQYNEQSAIKIISHLKDQIKTLQNDNNVLNELQCRRRGEALPTHLSLDTFIHLQDEGYILKNTMDMLIARHSDLENEKNKLLKNNEDINNQLAMEKHIRHEFFNHIQTEMLSFNGGLVALKADREEVVPTLREYEAVMVSACSLVEGLEDSCDEFRQALELQRTYVLALEEKVHVMESHDREVSAELQQVHHTTMQLHRMLSQLGDDYHALVNRYEACKNGNSGNNTPCLMDLESDLLELQALQHKITNDYNVSVDDIGCVKTYAESIGKEIKDMNQVYGIYNKRLDDVESLAHAINDQSNDYIKKMNQVMKDNRDLSHAYHDLKTTMIESMNDLNNSLISDLNDSKRDIERSDELIFKLEKIKNELQNEIDMFKSVTENQTEQLEQSKLQVAKLSINENYYKNYCKILKQHLSTMSTDMITIHSNISNGEYLNDYEGARSTLRLLVSDGDGLRQTLSRDVVDDDGNVPLMNIPSTEEMNDVASIASLHHFISTSISPTITLLQSLTQQISHLSQQNNSLSLVNEATESELNRIKSDVIIAENESQILKSQYEIANTEAEHFERLYLDTMSAGDALKEKLQNMEIEWFEVLGERENLLSEVDTQTNQAKQLQNKLNRCNEFIESVDMNHEALTKQVSLIESTLSELSTVYPLLTTRQEHSSKTQHLQADFFINLKKSVRQHEVTLMDVIEQYKNFQPQVHSILADNKNKENQIENLTIELLNSQVSSEKVLNDMSLTEMNLKQTIQDELIKFNEIELLQGFILKLQEENETLQNQITSLTEESQSNSLEINSLINGNNEIKQVNEKINDKNNSLTNQLNRLQGMHESLQILNEVKNSEIDDLINKIKQGEHLSTLSKGQVEDLIQQRNDLEIENNSLLELNNKNMDLLLKYKQQMEVLSPSQYQIPSLQKRIHELDAMVQMCTHEWQQMASEVSSLWSSSAADLIDAKTEKLNVLETIESLTERIHDRYIEWSKHHASLSHQMSVLNNESKKITLKLMDMSDEQQVMKLLAERVSLKLEIVLDASKVFL